MLLEAMRMLRRLELNNLAANICEEHWPEDFFVREIGCSQPASGFHVDNVLSKRSVLHFLFRGRGAYNGVSLSAGQGFLIAAGEPYSFRVFEEGDWKQYWIALHGAGIKCAVVSNKYEAAVKDICRLHFGDAFDTAVGENEGVAHKPAPDELIEAMKRLGVSPEESVMVGDGAQDILAGKNARCRTIGVTWGFRTRALLEESGADHIVDTAEELERLLLDGRGV